MEAISFTKTFTPILNSSRLTNFRFCAQPVSNLHGRRNSSRSKLFALSTVSTAADKIFDDPLLEAAVKGGPEEYKKFDWFAYWYPVMPVCDLDNRLPHAKTVFGLDLVAWWDRNEGAWKVFDDMCPHRLALLSEGRIDQWGRYTHPRELVHQYIQVLFRTVFWWVWPNSDPKYRDILLVQKPPYIFELDDPSFTKPLANRDFPFRWFSLDGTEMCAERVDREGGSPVEMKLEKFGINGFDTTRFGGESKFIAPCVYYSSVSATSLRELSRKKATVQHQQFQKLIFSFPRNFAVWADKLIPKWISHVGQNLVLDSDLYLLHLEERKIMEAGISNWSKACFMPTKADTQVLVSCGELQQLQWSIQSSESSRGSIAIVVATAKQSAALRSSVVLGVTAAVLCYAASRWLSHFIYKTFHFHDYTHAPWKLLGPSS
ncbi:Protochlorophyllide-dependent translocon component 52, chloroplastic [Linum perenne]